LILIPVSTQTRGDDERVCNACDVLDVVRNTIGNLKDTAEDFPNIVITSATNERHVNRFILTKLQVDCEMLLKAIGVLKTHMDSVSVHSLYNISLNLQRFFEYPFLDYDDHVRLLEELRELVFAFEDMLVTITHCNTQENNFSTASFNQVRFSGHSVSAFTSSLVVEESHINNMSTTSDACGVVNTHNPGNGFIESTMQEIYALTSPQAPSNFFTTHHQGTSKMSFLLKN
jgi:hypothetical protein